MQDTTTPRAGCKFGRLRVVGILRTVTERECLCQCECGRKLRCSWEDLKDRKVSGCDVCGPYERGISPGSSKQPETWSFCQTVKKPLLIRLKHMQDELPSWWWRSLNIIVDEMTQMLGRKIYTDEQIARFFECPVAAVDAVRGNYTKRIRQIHKEYAAVQEQFKHIPKIPSELICQRDVITLLEHALSHRASAAKRTGKAGSGDDY